MVQEAQTKHSGETLVGQRYQSSILEVLSTEGVGGSEHRYGFNTNAIQAMQQRVLPHAGDIISTMSRGESEADRRPPQEVSRAILMSDLMGRMSGLGPEYLARFYGGTLTFVDQLLSGLASDDLSIMDIGSSFGWQWDLLDSDILPNAKVSCVDDRKHIIAGANHAKEILGGRLEKVEFVHFEDGITHLEAVDVGMTSLAVQYGGDRTIFDSTAQHAELLTIHSDTAHAELRLPGMEEKDVQARTILPYGSEKYPREDSIFAIQITNGKPTQTDFGLVYQARLVVDKSKIATRANLDGQKNIRYVLCDQDNHECHITVYRNPEGELVYRPWALIPAEGVETESQTMKEAVGFWVTMEEIWHYSHKVEGSEKSWDANAILDTPHYAASQRLKSVVMATIPRVGEVPWLIIVAMIKRNQIMLRNLAARGALSQVGPDQDNQAFRDADHLLEVADHYLNPINGLGGKMLLANPPLIRVLTAQNDVVADKLADLNQLGI